jgi:hypothetical protein
LGGRTAANARLRLKRRSPTGHVAIFMPELFCYAIPHNTLKLFDYLDFWVSV